MSSKSPSSQELLWILPKEDPQWLQQIIGEFKIHPIVAQTLVTRGYSSLEEINTFLYARLPDLHDPFLFKEMPAAVHRIVEALKKEEKILVYGDNDVDGMTGTALLTEFLKHIGANVFFYLSQPGSPRSSLYIDALEDALHHGCKLMITVDSGITSADELLQYTSRGIDVIITDHHEPTETLPKCTAILNPKLYGEDFPYRQLVGVGVAFKLAHGITNYLVQEGMLSPKKVDLKRYLDLVALGTVSDMGALSGENRILVKYGIEQLRKTKRIGLAKLVSVSDVELSDINTILIATKIAPRLNSLGRIADPRKGVELLLLRNVAAAEKLAIELDLNNIERQRIERTMSADVEEILQVHPEILNNKAIVLSSENWHPGVIAIISTRICKQHNRPTVIIAIENEIGKGSVRSIPEFPVLDALKNCSDLLLNFGGHDFAAGLSLKKEHIEAFTRRFIQEGNMKLKDEDVKNKLILDAACRFDQLTVECMESLSLMEPFGSENPPPIFYTQAAQSWPPKIVGKTHLKLFLEQGDIMLEGLWPSQAAHTAELRRRHLLLNIAFSPQLDVFREQSCIKLLIRDCKIDQ